MARTVSGVMMSLGTVNMWGFSPGFDLHDGLPSDQQAASPTPGMEDAVDPVRILLIGPGDIRHALQTIASRRRWQGTRNRPLHVYIYEKSVETLARHLLLLQIAQDWDLPLRQRCNTFLEVFGNALLQERTSAYVEQQARALIDLLHNERGWLADQVDLTHLKMKTRDELVDTFHSWFESVRFDLVKLRDHRLRHFYEARFDYRNNLIDWDYTMGLRKIENASVIHIKQYREWRNSGIAFEFGDQTYTEPNRSMAAYTEAHQKRHGAVLCRGLWTDIVVGPYISLGVQCDRPNKFAEQLFEVHNRGTGVEQNRHNTAEVAVYNILSFLYEIETGEIYKMAKAHDVYSGIGESELERVSDGNADDSSGDGQEPKFEVIDEVADVAPSCNAPMTFSKEREAQDRAKTIVESLEGVKIIPITGKLEDLYMKKRYHHLFDRVFLSSQHCHTLQRDPQVEEPAPNLIDVLAKDAIVDIESSTFLLPLTEDQRVLYLTKLLEMARAHALKPAVALPTSPSKEDLHKIDNAVLRFQFTREMD